MLKTKEELNQLKQEFQTLTNKLKDLTEEELKLVTGGTGLTNTHPSTMFDNSDKLV